MSAEDVPSVVVYSHSLPPVRKALPPTEMIFPVKYLIRGVPKPLTSPVPEILVTLDPVKRGEYLVRLVSCGNCHTPAVRGQQLPGMAFAGGFTPSRPWGSATSPHLPPHPSRLPHY